MDFCTQYFKKNIIELEYKDLVDFFRTPKKESTHLEFKQFHSSTKEKDLLLIFKKSICAFLNSEGGILIYGAPKKQKDSDGKEFYQGELTPFPPNSIPDKDDLLRMIVDNIHSLPSGIKHELIKNGDESIGIFEIQPSQTKPHQTEDKYFIRLDGQNKAAPHYLIQALMRQIKYPDIRSYVQIENATYNQSKSGDGILIQFKIHTINFSETQNEKNVRVRVNIKGPGLLSEGLYDSEKKTKSTGYKELKILSYGEPNTLRYCISTSLRELQVTPRIDITCVFHGESSPSKMSISSLDCSDLNHPSFLVQKSRLKLVVDNLQFSEHQRNIGKSHIQSLKDSLGIELD